MNLIIGDSNSRNIILNTPYSTCLCVGGTAKELNNPKSKSNYNNIIINTVKLKNYNNLIFLFGNVDLEFCLIEKYINNDNINYKDFNLDIIKNYLNFILNNFYNKSIIILSIGLPCIDDIHFVDNYIHNGGRILIFENIDVSQLELLKSKIPNLLIRTQIILHFNETLKNEIIKLNNSNIKYLDITTFTFDSKLKRIKNEFFTMNNHHNYVRNIFFNKIINDYLLTTL